MNLTIEGLSEKQMNGFALSCKFKNEKRDETTEEFNYRRDRYRGSARYRLAKKKVKVKKLRQLKIIIFVDENSIKYEKTDKEVRICIN